MAAGWTEEATYLRRLAIDARRVGRMSLAITPVLRPI